MSMDNFQIDLKAVASEENVVRAMKLAFGNNAPGGKATGYAMLQNDQVLVLFWSGKEVCKVEKGKIRHYHRFPAPLDAEQAARFALGWLQDKDVTRLEHPGDFDGSIGKAFHLRDTPLPKETQGVLYPGSMRYAIASLTPIYAWYSK